MVERVPSRILTAVALAIAVIFTILFMIGGSMSTHQVNVWIDAAPEELFTWLHHPERLRLWLSGFVGSRPESQGPIGVGTRSLDAFEERGRTITMATEITDWQPPRVLAVDIDSRMLRGSTSYRLTEERGGTRVEFRADFRYRGLTRLLAPFIHGSVQRRQEQDLERLKSAFEATDGS